MTGNTGLATTTEFKGQTHAEYEQGRNRAGSARIRAPIVRFCACKVAWMNCPHRGYCAFAPAVSHPDPPALLRLAGNLAMHQPACIAAARHAGFPRGCPCV